VNRYGSRRDGGHNFGRNGFIGLTNDLVAKMDYISAADVSAGDLRSANALCSLGTDRVDCPCGVAKDARSQLRRGACQPCAGRGETDKVAASGHALSLLRLGQR